MRFFELGLMRKLIATRTIKRGRSLAGPPCFQGSRRLERDLTHHLNQSPSHSRSLECTVDAGGRWRGCVDLSKLSNTSCQIILWRIEIRIFEQVKEFVSKGEFKSLLDGKILHKARVKIEVARSTEQIPA